MNDPRIVQCSCCDGERRIITDYSEIECEACEGTGGELIETSPIELYDLPPAIGLPVFKCEQCDEDCSNDPHCICTDPWGGNRSIVCSNCQEQAYDDQQERLMENGPGKSLLEQQREARLLK